MRRGWGIAMARTRRAKIRAADLRGFKYFKILGPLLERLHQDAAQRDRAQNRQLHFDQYAALILLYFFNPILTSLRGIQQASGLDKVQKLLGCKRAALGSLSEASRVFDPQLLREIIGTLADQALPLATGHEAEALRGLTAVDGSFLSAVPKMAWALWMDDRHRAVKMHVHFDVLRAIPVEATLTPGIGSETEQLRTKLQPDRLYVIDRGYADYGLFQDIINAGSGFIGRLRDNAVWETLEERSVSPAARAAGVRRDCVVVLGWRQSGGALTQPLRVVQVSTGKTTAWGEPELLTLACNRLDLDAELIGLGYRYRWSIELFFRWFKCILGCQHLLSTDVRGVTIQVYLGIIASLLISIWTGKKPTKRTWEMLQFYFSGWANEDELMQHIQTLHDHAA